MVIIFIQTHFYSIVSLETHINTRFVQTGFPHMFPSKHLVIFKILLFVLPIFESFALFLITHDHNINSDSFLLNSFSWNRHHHKIYSNWFCPHVSLKTLGHIQNTVVGFAFIYFCKFCPFSYIRLFLSPTTRFFRSFSINFSSKRDFCFSSTKIAGVLDLPWIKKDEIQ